MKRYFLVAILMIALATLVYAFAESQNIGGIFRTATPTSTSTPTFTSTSTTKNTVTSTLTATFTNTPTLTPSPTATNTPISLSATKKPKDNDDTDEGNTDDGCVDSCEPPGGGGN